MPIRARFSHSTSCSCGGGGVEGAGPGDGLADGEDALDVQGTQEAGVACVGEVAEVEVREDAGRQRAVHPLHPCWLSRQGMRVRRQDSSEADLEAL